MNWGTIEQISRFKELISKYEILEDYYFLKKKYERLEGPLKKTLLCVASASTVF